MSLAKQIAVYTTVADEETARRIARALVDEGLVACVNFFPIRSVYRWEGTREEADEHALIMKTRGELYGRLEGRLRELHPYDLPAIVAYEIAAGLPAYLAWIDASTEAGAGSLD